MASINLTLFKGKTLKNNSHPVMLQVIHNRQVRRVSLGYSATDSEWDETLKEFTRRKANYKWLNNKIKSERNEFEAAILKMEEHKENLTMDQLLSILKRKSDRVSFFKFTKQIVDDMIKARQVGNATVYKQVYNILMAFQEGNDLTFEDITYTWLNELEVFHLSKGNSINGLNVYMRTIRAIYNRAINAGLAKAENYPFKKYKLKLNKTPKKAISKGDIDRIKSIELPYATPIWHAKNLFLFSFYTRGMNWVDIALLTRQNISDGRINYKRAKTGKEYSIKVNEQIGEILNFYLSGDERKEFVFPILISIDDPMVVKKKVDNGLRNFNKQLKKIGKLCGIEKNLTSYVSRHSWGTIGFKELNIPIGIISQGYGHEDIKTTQIYLEEFDLDTLDSANDSITK